MDKWEEAVINQCMSIEGCYVKDDPEKTLNCLIQWHVDLALESTVSIWDLVEIRDLCNNKILDNLKDLK